VFDVYDVDLDAAISIGVRTRDIDGILDLVMAGLVEDFVDALSFSRSKSHHVQFAAVLVGYGLQDRNSPRMDRSSIYSSDGWRTSLPRFDIEDRLAGCVVTDLDLGCEV
jgi:hypothetical protein